MKYSELERMLLYEMMILYFEENIITLGGGGTLSKKLNWGFCECICDIESEGQYDGTMDNFPELLAEEPDYHNRFSGGWWFDPVTIEGQQKRIDLLKKILNTYDEKN